jgi:hypothetical protein
MSAEIPQFANLTLNKIGDLGVHVLDVEESPHAPVDPREHDIEEAEKKRPPGR